MLVKARRPRSANYWLYTYRAALKITKIQIFSFREDVHLFDVMTKTSYFLTKTHPYLKSLTPISKDKLLRQRHCELLLYISFVKWPFDISIKKRKSKVIHRDIINSWAFFDFFGSCLGKSILVIWAICCFETQTTLIKYGNENVKNSSM